MSRRAAVFGITPPGALIGQRLALVEDAWSRLTVAAGKHAAGDRVPLDTLLRHYDANRHPLHARGWTSRGRLQDLFEASFRKVAVSGPETGVDYVTRDAFVDFYVKLSQEVQVMRQKGEAALDPDAFFCAMVEQTWHLDEEWGLPESRRVVAVAAPAAAGKAVEAGSGDGAAAKRAAAVVVVQAETDSDDECQNANMHDVLRPTGVKALQSVHRPPVEVMDLVWRDDKTKALVGFRGVVRPLFCRAALPAPLRGHVLLAQESLENRVRFVPTRPTNQAALDFVWEDVEGSGRLCGLRGVVSSAVDLVVAPDAVKQHLMTPAQSAAAGVEFAETDKPANGILFKRVNDAYGMDAVEEARRTAALKKAVFEGTACGNVYATTWSGKFSDQFPGGPYRQQGLNTAQSRPRVAFGSGKNMM